MALGTWEILNYRASPAAWETLNTADAGHKSILEGDAYIFLRDGGMSGAGDQRTAALPVVGPFDVYYGAISVAGYTSGALSLSLANPLSPSNLVLLGNSQQGSGGQLQSGAVSATKNANRGGYMVSGYVVPEMCVALVGAGGAGPSATLLVAIVRRSAYKR